MEKKSFIMDIRIDEKILKEKYPNYKFNFGSVNGFVTFLVANIMRENSKDYGYSVSITPYHNK